MKLKWEQSEAWTALDSFLIFTELGVRPNATGLERFKTQAASAIRDEKVRRRLPVL